MLDHPKQALEYYKQALHIADELGDIQSKGVTYGNMGRALINLGKIQEALVCLGKRLEIARQLYDPKGEEWALTHLGLIYSDIGDYHQAIQYIEESLAVEIENDDLDGTTYKVFMLGTLYSEIKQWNMAITYYEQFQSVCQTFGFEENLGISFWYKSLAQAALGSLPTAIESARSALHLLKQQNPEIEAQITARLEEWVNS